MGDAQAWALEERLWLEGSNVYDGLLHPECVMAFPGMGGVMRAANILDSLKDAPRWASVRMTGRAVGRPSGGDVLVLGYAAEAVREGAVRYRCICTSTYHRDGDGKWRIVQHQQTLAG